MKRYAISLSLAVLAACAGSQDSAPTTRADSRSVPRHSFALDSTLDPGTCCQPHSEVGCTNAAVQACATQLWPSCGTQSWSFDCIDTAKRLCGLYCATNCCSPHAGSSCDYAETADCTCYFRPQCCTGPWDQACVDAAQSQCSLKCPLPPTNDCCTVHAGPGCTDPDLKDCVLTTGQACGRAGHDWDTYCTGIAKSSCGACGLTCGNGICEANESCVSCSADCGCAAPQVCNVAAKTCCTPNCNGKECGSDGCGHSCGSCDDGSFCTGETCNNGHCDRWPYNTGNCDDGDPCTLGDHCSNGVCTGDLDPSCATLSRDLGAPLGVVSFVTPVGNGCYRGTQSLNPCTNLPFCSFEATWCPGTGAGETITLSATVDFGPLGTHPLQGTWKAAGTDLTATLPSLSWPELAGTFEGDTTLKVSIASGAVAATAGASWKPFAWDPDFQIKAAAALTRDSNGLKLVVDQQLGDYRPFLTEGPTNPYYGFFLSNARLTAVASSNAQGWHWDVNLEGDAHVATRDLNFVVHVSGQVMGGAGITWSGRAGANLSLFTQAAGFVEVQDPFVSITLVDGKIDLFIESQALVNLAGSKLPALVRGGGALTADAMARLTGTFDSCANLPFCNFDLVTVSESGGNLGVALNAELDYGPFGHFTMTGNWQSSGSLCMKGTASSAILGAIPGHVPASVELTACAPGFERQVTIPSWFPFKFDTSYSVSATGKLTSTAQGFKLVFDTALGVYSPLDTWIDPAWHGLELTNAHLHAEATASGLSMAWVVTLTGDYSDDGYFYDLSANFTGLVTNQPRIALYGEVRAQQDLGSQYVGAKLRETRLVMDIDGERQTADLSMSSVLEMDVVGFKAVAQMHGDRLLRYGVGSGLEGTAHFYDPKGHEVRFKLGGHLSSESSLGCIGIRTLTAPLGKKLCGGDQVGSVQLTAQLDLPHFVKNQPALPVVIVPSPTQAKDWIVDAAIPYAVESLEAFPSKVREAVNVDRLTLKGIRFRHTAAGAEAAPESDTWLIDAQAEMVPHNEPNKVLKGTASLERRKLNDPSMNTYNSLFGEDWVFAVNLRGRWLDPLGMKGYAIEDPALALPVMGVKIGMELIGWTPVPYPDVLVTRFGLRSYTYARLDTSPWPAEPPEPTTDHAELCSDLEGTDEDGNGKANCDDPACAGHLACLAKNPASNLEILRLTAYLDLDTGFNPVGGEVHATHWVLRLEGARNSDGLLYLSPDLVSVTKRMQDLAANGLVLLDEAPGIPTDLGNELRSMTRAALPCNVVSCKTGALSFSPLKLSATGFVLHLASEPITLWDTYYPEGAYLNLDLEGEGEGKRVALHGGSDADGLVLGARVPKLALPMPPMPAGLDEEVDPMARLAHFPDRTGWIKVPADSRLNLPQGTVEAFVSRSAWDSSTATLASTSGGQKAGNGWSITLSDPQDGRARVAVHFYKAGASRTVRTTKGVVPAGLLSHVAVSWAPNDAGATEVKVYVNGQRVAVEDSARTDAQKIAPGSRMAVLSLGRGLDRLDEFRVWNKERSAARIAAFSRLLPQSEQQDASLLVNYRFDFDLTEPGIHNSRHLSGARLHGEFVGSGEIAKPEAFDSVEVALALGSAPGLLFASGLEPNVVLPFDQDKVFSLQAAVGNGKAEGSAYARPMRLLQIPGIGTFSLTGDGPDSAGDATFDDGIFGNADLIAGSIGGSGRLLFQREGNPADLLGKATFTISPNTFAMRLTEASAQGAKVFMNNIGKHLEIALTPVTEVNLEPDGTTPRLRLKGKIVVAQTPSSSGPIPVPYPNLPTSDMLLSAERATFHSSLPTLSLMGANLSSAELDLTAKLPSLEVCGTGKASFDKLRCDVSVCFRDNGPAGTVTCGGTSLCVSDSDCSGKICVVGVCRTKFPDNAPCASGSQCQSGSCAGLCYTPGAKHTGEVCVATPLGVPSSCMANNICVGVCLPLVSHGDFCTDEGQCPSGTQCLATNGTMALHSGASMIQLKRCLYPEASRALGQGCSDAIECVSSACTAGVCRCTPRYCNESYCSIVDGQCHSLKANGESCCTSLECLSADCTVEACTVNLNGSLSGGKCFEAFSLAVGQACSVPTQCASGLCSGGRCRCAASAQCSSSQRCDPVTLLCRPKLGEGEVCNPLVPQDCLSGHCAAGLSGPRCYTPGAAHYGDACFVNEHCSSDSCKPICSWSLDPWGTCGMLRVADRVAHGDWDALAGCGCQTRCQCGADTDCPSDKRCASMTVGTSVMSGFGECADKKSFGSLCSRDGECKSGYCRQGLVTSNCGCRSSDDCEDGGKLCSDGKCYPKKGWGVPCSGGGECSSGDCHTDGLTGARYCN